MRRNIAAKAADLTFQMAVVTCRAFCAPGQPAASGAGAVSKAPNGTVIAGRVGRWSARSIDVLSCRTRRAVVGLPGGAKRHQSLAWRFVCLFCRRGGGGVASGRDELFLTGSLLAEMRRNVASEAVALLSASLVPASRTVGTHGIGAAGRAIKVKRVGKLAHGAHLAREISGYRACVTDARARRADSVRLAKAAVELVGASGARDLDGGVLASMPPGTLGLFKRSHGAVDEAVVEARDW